MPGKTELVLLSDEVWERTRERLDGLTDEEYFWEPAPGCWSVRQRRDGRWAHDRWDAHLHLVTEEQLAMPIGPVGGEYGERTRTSYVLHMLDEYIHHGAEISLLRDLWRWQPATAEVLDGRTGA